MSAAAAPAEVKFCEHSNFDEHAGSKHALVAAGFAAADQFPGEPGRNKLVCTYHRGVLLGKGGKPPERDQDWRQIKHLRNGQFVVRIGLARDERERRRQAELADRAQAATRTTRTPRVFGHLRLVWVAPAQGARS